MKKTRILCVIPSIILLNSLLIGTPTIHVFGDSHASFCFSNRGELAHLESSAFNYKSNTTTLTIPFNISWLGPRTMYGMGRDGIKALNINSCGVKENDIVVFVFGEIDVRYHIGKQRDKYNRSLDEIITSLVKSYLDLILKNKMLYNNISCVIMSIMPPRNGDPNSPFPFYGSLEDRIKITYVMNETLKNFAMHYGIHFLDIYDLFATPEGTLNLTLSDGNVHAGMQYNYLIKNRLTKMLLQNNIMQK